MIRPMRSDAKYIVGWRKLQIDYPRFLLKYMSAAVYACKAIAQTSLASCNRSHCWSLLKGCI